MNENAITVALIQGLRACGTEATRRFIRDVAGTAEGTGRLDYWDDPTAMWSPPDRPARALVLGLASTPRVDQTDKRGPAWAEGKVDAAIWDDEILVVLESKVRGGVLNAAQMVRHATVVAQQVPEDRFLWSGSDLPAGFAVSTWTHVAGWLGRELSATDHRHEGAAQHLAETLKSQGICVADPKVPPVSIASRTRPRTAKPPKPHKSEIGAQWNLERVREICLATYGAEPIKEDDCTSDTQRLADAFRAAGQPVPVGLRYPPHDGAMTPERILSVLYGYSAGARSTLLSNAYPDNWSGMKMRTVGSGADQHALVAMLAWAGSPAHAKTAASKRIFQHVPLSWASAPYKAPGSERLHAALASARR